jgi:ubiquinone/menaquinone biosynthesis C-methylase UbiE
MESESDNIEHENFPTAQTNRSFQEYRHYLDLPSEEELKNKLVLDIGSGLGGRFVKEAKFHGIKAVGLNPNLNKSGSREELDQKHDWTLPDVENEKLFVAGEAKKLPFKDNSFDAVVSLFAIPLYLPNRADDYKLVFNEIVRVLKPGGKAYLFPISKEIYEGKMFNRIAQEISDTTEFNTQLFTDYKTQETDYRLVIQKNL